MWKVLAFLAGAAGVVGFFLPLVEFRDPHKGAVAPSSAYEIATTELDSGNLGAIAESFGMSRENARELSQAVNQGLLAYRGAIVGFYIPTATLALLGFANVVRWRMGRFTGLLALVLGAATTAVFVIFAIPYLGGDQRSPDPQTSLGPGIWLLAVAGGGGLFAGLGALLSPDTGRDR